ncbi:single-stranded DNA-binding protein [bacterium]|jgi:single-strand DNA-binding protein|nr:single-stranded DNA-binding protein [bacterium]
MGSLNKVLLIGRLGRDPEIRYSSNNTPICNFSIATSERVRKGDTSEEKTEWHRIVLFGNQAENASKFLKKGSLVFVDGKIQSRSYQDKEGNERTVFEIIANSWSFVGDPNKENSSGQSERTYQQNPKEGEAQPQTGNAPKFDNEDDELPF